MTKIATVPFLLGILSIATVGSPEEPRAGAKGTGAPSEAVPGIHYRFEKVADGVFCAIPDGTPYFVSNSVVIVGPESVLVVDTGAGPAEARVLQEGIKTLTDRPVAYLVLTHFHFDHASGNAAFPGALILGHEATRGLLAERAIEGRTVAGYLTGLPAQITRARAEADAEASAEKRAELTRRVASIEAYRTELSALVPLPPQVTFRDELTLWLGQREIRLVHPGRGHTAGDVIVYLPQERIVCSGDFFNGYIGYMGDAYVDEWADSLARLAALDFETVIPGHGAPFKGKDAIALVQACLRDLFAQAAELKRQGVAASLAATRIDLRAHSARFPRLAQVGFDPAAVKRIYEVIDERASLAR
jgi:cyclase